MGQRPETEVGRDLDEHRRQLRERARAAFLEGAEEHSRITLAAH